MKDRISTIPGKFKFTYSDGTVKFATIERADEATETGDPLNKATLLPDNVATALGLNPENNPLPADAFASLNNKKLNIDGGDAKDVVLTFTDKTADATLTSGSRLKDLIALIKYKLLNIDAANIKSGKISTDRLPELNNIKAGSSNFVSTTGVVINHDLGSILPSAYQVAVTPSAAGNGNIGEIYITKGSSGTFTVFCTGSATTAFDWIAVKI